MKFLDSFDIVAVLLGVMFTIRKLDAQSRSAAQHPEVVARMAATLDAWRRRAEAERLPSDAVAESQMSAEELQQLRSLGYIR